jgi:stringent starvation protein B
MISNRPYLIRAVYQWIVDNDWTPHMQVDALYPGVEVPNEFVENGVIILNVSPQAVLALDMANEGFRFRARFQGVERKIAFPPQAVLAVFARENGQGMPFPPEPYPQQDEDAAAAKPKRPTLTRVK